MHSAILPTHEKFLPKKHGREAGFFDRCKTLLPSRGYRGTVNKLSKYALCLLVSYALFLISGPSSGNGAYHYYDLNKFGSSPNAEEALERGEKVLMCIPLRNANSVLDLMWSHLHNITYPHELIDIAFLVGDSDDGTPEELLKGVEATEAWDAKDQYNRIEIFNRDFGAVIGQGVDDRHGVAVQGVRRKLMGRARNWLLSAALRPDHSWVYWRDADIETAPASLIQDLMNQNKDVIVPNVWRPLPKFLGGQQPYDLNSWVESSAALELAKTLDEDDVIVEGYAEYPTWRVHLAYLRSDSHKGNPNEVMNLDGIGGVSILSKARVFRAGVNFPGFAFENHAETEGYGKMARKMHFSVAGLVQYTIWHKYEPSEDDIKQMAELKASGLPYD